MLDRRAFVGALGLLAVPLGAAAQPAGKLRIGYLSGNPHADTQDAIDAFRARLRDLGYLDGQNLLIEYRYADGKYERLPQLAAELVRLKVDVIFAFSTPGSRAASTCSRGDRRAVDRLDDVTFRNPGATRPEGSSSMRNDSAQLTSAVSNFGH